MPGVSRKAICPRFPSLRMPTMRLRVVCGFSETMETFCPRIRFRSVDLPALGRPTRATTPKRGLRGLNGPFGLMIDDLAIVSGYRVAGLPRCRVTWGCRVTWVSGFTVLQG